MFQESEQLINNMEGPENASAAAEAVAQPKSKMPCDAITGKKLARDTKIDGKKVISYSQVNNNWPYDAATGARLKWGDKIDGKKVIPSVQVNNNWPYDAATGERLEWGDKVDGKKVITYSQLKNRWPYNAKTGERLKWGTKIDGKKVIRYGTLRDRWPHDKRTGEKLKWDATGFHVTSYHQLNKFRPTDKATGKSLPYGTPLGDNVVTRYVFSQEYTFVGSDKKTYKGEKAKATALLENPNLTFQSKKELHSAADIARPRSKMPYDAITGKKLEWDTEIDGKKVITYSQLNNRWPYDAITGKKLEWGDKVDGKKVISYQTLKEQWPYDKRTGKKLEWGATGTHVVSYQQLNKLRPIDKVTGKPLPYGTPLGDNVVTRRIFSQEYTFVGSDKKTYKGEEAKAKALSENPTLTFKSKKEIHAEKYRTSKAIAKKKSASDAAENPAAFEPQIPSAPALSSATDDWVDDVEDYIALSPTLDAALNEVVASIASQAQSQTEDALVLVANSPTLDLELNALLEGIDTSASLAQPPEFMPAYSATTTETATSTGTTAKRSKRNDNDAAAIMFSPNSSSNRQF